MKILISGSSGFIGTELVTYLRALGHQVYRLVRDKKKISADAIFWDPKETKDLKALEGMDIVINLAGENIANGRWNEEKKKRIFDSRVKGTKALVQALCQLNTPPNCLISASAIGIYGNKTSTYSNEYSDHGTSFLAHVCEEWEKATQPAIAHNIRTVNLRFGIVLSAKGGALSKMLVPFKLGLGGRLGSGNQYMSWIAIDDLLAIILFMAMNKTLKGPYNVVAPYPIKNSVFTKTLADILERPCFLPVPEFVLNLILGKEMAGELLLNSTRVEPLRLTQAGYSFLFPDLKLALEHLLE